MAAANPIRMLSAVTLALCGCSLWSAHGQTIDRTDPITISLSYVDKHLFVRLEDTALGKLNLLLDTGADRTILFNDSLDEGVVHNLSSKHASVVNGLGEGARERSGRRIPVSLRDGSRLVFTGDAIILQAGKFSRESGHPMDGVLGWDFFEKWCVRLDYGKLQISLFARNLCGPADGEGFVLNDALSEHGAFLPMTISFVKGNPIRARVRMDTGMDTSIVLNPRFCGAAGMDKHGPSNRKVNGVGINGPYTIDTVIAPEMELGDGTVEFENATIFVPCSGGSSWKHWWSGAHKNAPVDGWIGNAVLEQMLMTLDPENRRVYLEPNPAFTAPVAN